MAGVSSRRCSMLPCLAFVALAALSAAPAAAGNSDQVIKDTLAALDLFADAAEKVRDRASARAARPKLQMAIDRLEAIKKREASLGRPTAREKERLGKKFEKEIGRVQARFTALQQRFERMPAVLAELRDVGERFQRIGGGGLEK